MSQATNEAEQGAPDSWQCLGKLLDVLRKERARVSDTIWARFDDLMEAMIRDTDKRLACWRRLHQNAHVSADVAMAIVDELRELGISQIVLDRVEKRIEKKSPARPDPGSFRMMFGNN